METEFAIRADGILSPLNPAKRRCFNISVGFFTRSQVS